MEGTIRHSCTFLPRTAYYMELFFNNLQKGDGNKIHFNSRRIANQVAKLLKHMQEITGGKPEDVVTEDKTVSLIVSDDVDIDRRKKLAFTVMQNIKQRQICKRMEATLCIEENKKFETQYFTSA